MFSISIEWDRMLCEANETEKGKGETKKMAEWKTQERAGNTNVKMAKQPRKPTESGMLYSDIKTNKQKKVAKSFE